MTLENGKICLDGEPLYTASGINLAFLADEVVIK